MKKWTPKMKAKAAATRAANKAKNSVQPNIQHVSDCMAYLLKAEQALLARRSKRIGGVETLMLLALNSLRGEL